eukprot:SAG31_NODE_28031_length_416_cov_0.993691_2_plen_42_part_01
MATGARSCRKFSLFSYFIFLHEIPRRDLRSIIDQQDWNLTCK